MKPNEDKHSDSSGLPEPEVLTTHSDKDTPDKPDKKEENAKNQARLKSRRTTYRPSHRATFIGLFVVVGVLLVNAAIITIVILTQGPSDESNDQATITLDTDVLNSLGVSRNQVGNEGSKLEIGPDTTFLGTVDIGGDTSISGNLTLNSDFTANRGVFTNLQAGDTAVDSLNVNGDATASNLLLRGNITVPGTSTFQGTLTANSLVTVNNNANITGSLGVGGTLSVRDLHVIALQTDSTLTIGGHIITSGSAPSVSKGAGTGSSGTVSVSGSDSAGTIAVNIGTGGGNGLLAQLFFRGQYSSTPHVLITAVNKDPGTVYVTRTTSGFSIYSTQSIAPGGYVFDYLVVQ